MANDDERIAREKSFLAAIAENPNDEESRLVYADWLEENGDERAEYLRLENQMWKLPPRIRELHTRMDPVWLAAVGRRVDLVFVSSPNKISAIKLVREITGLGLKDAKDLVEAAPPAIIVQDISFEEASHYRDRFEKESKSVVEIRQAPVRRGYFGPPPYATPEIPPNPLAIMRAVLVSYPFPESMTVRINVMRVIRQVTNLSLVETKALIEALPQTLRDRITQEEAEAIRAQFGDLAEIRIERGGFA